MLMVTAERMKADLERIAREILSVETLETRNRDSLDFSEQSCGTLSRALEAAYQAGVQEDAKRRCTVIR